MCLDINALLTGVLTSFVASLVFTFLFTRLKPRLEIADIVAIKQTLKTTTYKIKVINKSQVPIINIKAELVYINFFQVPNGHETNSKKIKLNKSEIFILDKFDLKSETAAYTYLFVTKVNIKEGLVVENKDYIRFRISATHSLSNMGRIFEKKYYPDSFSEGEYRYGNSTKIVK
jgi:hypothetical protein